MTRLRGQNRRTIVLGRGRALRPTSLLVGLAIAFGSACATEQPGISPERDAFYFPTGLALDPKRPILYLSNTNADLRFNGGTVMALDLRKLPKDLSRVSAAVSQGRLSCRQDPIEISRWECDAKPFIIKGATVRVGDFPAQMAVSPDGKRVFTPVRGSDELSWMDVADLDGGSVDLRCNDDPSTGCARAGNKDCTVWDCDDAHRVDFSRRTGTALPPEPFGLLLNHTVAVHIDSDGVRHTCRDGLSKVACDCGSAKRCVAGAPQISCCIDAASVDHVYVAHLSGGEVSLFTSDAKGVELQHVQGGFFSSTSSIRGGYTLAPSLPGDPTSPIYVGSRTDNTLGAFVVRDNREILRTRGLSVNGLSPGSDVRAIAFSPGAKRLYVVNRAPPGVEAIDMEPEDGIPRGRALWAVPVCSEPSQLRLGPAPHGGAGGKQRDRLLYIVCFAGTQIQVIDTQLAQPVGLIFTGQGPHSLALDEKNKRAFVTNFLENTIGVIDLDPEHASYRRMVLRIGRPKDLIKD